MTDKINYTHGDSGSQPPDGNDFETNERPQASYFDWYISTFVSKINSLVGDVNDLISGTVQAGDADKVDGQDYADIQNWVNSSADVPNADHADTADSATDADTVDGEHASAFADTNHGNEEHSSTFTTLSEVNTNADVPNADYADTAGDADTVDGQDYADIQNWVETSATANNADTVDGLHASALYGAGYSTIMDTEIGAGGSHDIDRYASLPTGTTLEVRALGIANTSFNAPAGLQIIVRDTTNGTNLATYNTTHSEVNDSIDISGIDVVITVDNGEYGAGTGSTQQVAGHIATRLS